MEKHYRAFRSDISRRLRSTRHKKRGPVFLRLVIAWLALVALLTFLRVEGLVTSQRIFVLELRELAVVFILVLLFISIFVAVYWRAFAHHRPNDKGLLLGSQTIRLTEAGIEQRGEAFSEGLERSKLFTWNRVTRTTWQIWYSLSHQKTSGPPLYEPRETLQRGDIN